MRAGMMRGLSHDRVLQSLPLLTLHLTERCNSRCVSCDYWRHGKADLTLEAVVNLLPSLRALDTHTVLISGGEPLLHPQWMQIAAALRTNGQQLWLLTSGLALAKHAAQAQMLFSSITVSLDGTDRAMYTAIRGLDAFEKVCEGIQRAVAAGACVSLRVTVQQSNYRALPEFVRLAHELGAMQISFLAADVSNPHAFGRQEGFAANIALRSSDLDEFARVLDGMEREHVCDFDSGFIAERPAKLRRLLQYYAAICGVGEFPPPRCNAPEFSAVVDARGRVMPCFFIAGPPSPTLTAEHNLDAALNDEAMVSLRDAIRAGQRAECATCVCSLWREPDQLTARHFRLQ